MSGRIARFFARIGSSVRRLWSWVFGRRGPTALPGGPVIDAEFEEIPGEPPAVAVEAPGTQPQEVVEARAEEIEAREVIEAPAEEAEPEPEPEEVIEAPAEEAEPESEPEEVVEAPAEEPEPEEVVEAPAEEPEPEEVVEAPAEEPEPEEVVEAPAGEPESEEVVEAPAEEPELEEVVEAPAEEPEPEEVVEAPVEAAAPDEVTQAPAEEPEPEEVVEAPVEAAAPDEVTQAPAEEPEPEEVVEAPVEAAEPDEATQAPAEEPEPEEVVEAPVETAEPDEVTQVPAESPEPAEAIAEEPEQVPAEPVAEPIDIPSDYVPAPESAHELFRLNIDGFTGPLDLLLFLIRRHKIDVFDIPMAFICERYLECLQVLEDLDVDVAAGFMLMASDLLHIKSKMLLPSPVDLEEDEEELDPRAELVRRLLEYEKYKNAAEQLGALHRLGRDVFPHEAEPPPETDEEAPLREVGVYALIEAFDQMLKRAKPELVHRVEMAEVSVRERIDELINRLADRRAVRFSELFEEAQTKLNIVVSLLAILEMTKLGLLRILQSTGPQQEIYLQANFEGVADAQRRAGDLDESYAG